MTGFSDLWSDLEGSCEVPRLGIQVATGKSGPDTVRQVLIYL